MFCKLVEAWHGCDCLEAKAFVEGDGWGVVVSYVQEDGLGPVTNMHARQQVELLRWWTLSLACVRRACTGVPVTHALQKGLA